jgi:thiamine transport system ATP-binding protein
VTVRSGRALVLDGVGVRFDGRAALDGVDLAFDDTEIVALLGPSGSGKTTLLRVVAGLQAPTVGRVLLDGRDLAEVPVHRRGVGLMFQDFALFPHRDVGGNVAFGLRMQGVGATEVETRVAEVLELVGLAGTERRAVSTLSGGEQQRVALARALAPRPRVLMLDEPMGSLDRVLRERLPLELRRIFEGLGVTVLYVTHDQDEALAVADRTVLLRDGRVEADASSEALWSEPPTAFAARFLGLRNVAAGRVVSGRTITPWAEMDGVAGAADGPDRGVTVVLRSGSVTLSATGRIRGTVTARRFQGDHVAIQVQVPGATVPLEIEARGAPLPRAGEDVGVAIDPRGVLLLPPED